MKHDWPKTLKLDPGAFKALEAVPDAHPVLAQWPEGAKLRMADDAKAIGAVLIGALHPELVNANIAFLAREKVGGRGRTYWGKAYLCSSREKFLTEFDFVVLVNWSTWKPLPLVQRCALIDHQLEHLGVDDNGAFILLDYDLQEYNAIVSRWGLWQPSIKPFLEAAKPQMELALAQ